MMWYDGTNNDEGTIMGETLVKAGYSLQTDEED